MLVEVFVNFYFNKTLLFDKFFHKTLFQSFISKIGGISVETKIEILRLMRKFTKPFTIPCAQYTERILNKISKTTNETFAELKFML